MSNCRRFLVSVALLIHAAAPFAAAQTRDALAARAAEASTAMESGRFDAAATIYEELVAARPGDAGLLMNLGMARYMAGHPDLALPPLQRAARLNRSLAPASLFLGASLLDLGRLKDAATPLLRAVTLMPRNPDAREMLARTYVATSSFSKAVPHYRMLTTLQPLNPRGWYGLARSYEGIAQAAFDALQRDAPDSPLLELLGADVAVTQDKFAAALAIYRRALTAGAPVGGLHETVAELYERAGKPEWAATELQHVKAQPPAYCTTRAAECLFLRGKFRESLAAAERTADAVSRFWAVRAANRLAVDAVTHLETVPPSIELHLIRAEIAQSRGRGPESVAEVRAALVLSPGNPAIENALAEALLRAHNLDEAIPLLERLNNDRPGNGPLLLMYGDALLLGQQLDRAIPILEQAVKATDAPLESRALLGRAYVQAGRYQDAVAHLEASVPVDQDGDVHYQLARAYQALGRNDEAQRALAEYQRHRPTQAPEPASEQQPAGTLTPPND